MPRSNPVEAAGEDRVSKSCRTIPAASETVDAFPTMSPGSYFVADSSIRMFLLSPFEHSSAPPSNRVGVLYVEHTKFVRSASFALLSRAHTSNRGHRFPELVPAPSSRWTLNVDVCLTLPIGYLKDQKRMLVVLFLDPRYTSCAFIHPSSVMGSISSTNGSSEYPNIRAGLAALMFTNIATHEFHAGPGVEVESHLTFGL